MTRIRYTLVAIGAALGFTAFVVVGLASFTGTPARDTVLNSPSSVPGPPVALGSGADVEPHCPLATIR